MEPGDRWTVEHFSLSNPKGPGQGDVPALLRRLAEVLAEKGNVQVQDVVFHMDVDDEAEDWPTATVYFHQR